MKIINNTDLNNLILFSKKNLNMYKLVYQDKKYTYFLSLFFTFLSICLLAISIFFSFINITFLDKIFSGSCLFTCLLTLGLLKYIDIITKDKHLTIQENRFKLLKKYYHDNNFNYGDIKIINQQLEKRIKKIEKQKITILVVIGIFLLPLWDILIQFYFEDFSSIKIFKFFVFSIVFSFIALIVTRFFNRALYLYEENFYIKNNIAVIENLIYLNRYIIQAKGEKTKKH